MSRPTVLLNMPGQPPGHPTGVGRFGLALATKLAERGTYDYAFRTAYGAEELPKALTDTGVRIISAPPVKNYIASVVWQTLVGPWRQPASQYDIVLNLDPYGTGSGGRRRATVIHDVYFKTIPDCVTPRSIITAGICYAVIMRGSNRLVAISDTTADDIAKFYPWARSRTKTIYSDSTLPIDPLAQRAASIIDHPYVLAVANTTPNKNLGVLAEAMVRLHRTHPQIGLVHVGGDANQVLAKALEKADSPIKLTRLTGISEADLTALYQNALCLCVPSLYEGFCLPLVEAQKLGCPVVFSNRSAAAEVGGDGGLAFDPTDADGLAGLLKSIAEQPELRASLTTKGLENAKRFSWDLAAERYEALFAELLAS